MPDPSGAPSTPRDRRATALFAKCPRPGRVKTRLCPPLDPERAAELAEAMLRDLVDRLVGQAEYRTLLLWAPAEEEAWFASELPAALERRVQRGDGLARRLANWFRDELAGGGRTAVAVGSDAPLLSPELPREAHERLESGADLVLGPDAGGGYYLVGLREPCDELFTEVQMSTGDMYANTLEVAERLGLTVETVAPLYDVDVEADLVRLRRDLERLDPGDPRYPARTASLLARAAGGRA